MTTTEPLRYAVDITQDDVDALTSWLTDRLIHRPSMDVDTEEYRTNAALRYLVPGFAGTLSHWFGDEVVERAQTDSEARLRRIQGIQKTWNLLAEAVYPWRDSDGFDTERWHTVRFYDAEDEERLRQHEEKEKAAAAEATAFVSEYRIPGPAARGRTSRSSSSPATLTPPIGGPSSRAAPRGATGTARPGSTPASLGPVPTSSPRPRG
ncbi:hypothetical protein [Streptomyces sp. PsTaAH-124]|uniref:hypothetical protein n=1 Tax=Streptomyces sp. PsTaAH-124 TaxID=1157638 RepID=UPI000366B6D3|nr:hypothetical protein [Streptomyces sp. PsTaAH-124]